MAILANVLDVPTYGRGWGNINKKVANKTAVPAQPYRQTGWLNIGKKGTTAETEAEANETIKRTLGLAETPKEKKKMKKISVLSGILGA